MGLFKRKKRQPAIHIGDPRFDEWEVVRDFEDLKTAQAWQRHAVSVGIENVLTSDWPLDEFNRGDIALRVPSERWSEAEEFFGNIE